MDFLPGLRSAQSEHCLLISVASLRARVVTWLSTYCCDPGNLGEHFAGDGGTSVCCGVQVVLATFTIRTTSAFSRGMGRRSIPSRLWAAVSGINIALSKLPSEMRILSLTSMFCWRRTVRAHLPQRIRNSDTTVCFGDRLIYGIGLGAPGDARGNSDTYTAHRHALLHDDDRGSVRI
jgi:hypothetical protein